MEEKSPLTQFPPDFSDLDNSFTSSSNFLLRHHVRLQLLRTQQPQRQPQALSFSSDSSTAAPVRPLPHSRSDPHWSAIRAVTSLPADGSIHLRHLRLLIGSGNLARVFHCRLRGFDGDDSPAAPAKDATATTTTPQRSGLRGPCPGGAQPPIPPHALHPPRRLPLRVLPHRLLLRRRPPLPPPPSPPPPPTARRSILRR